MSAGGSDAYSNEAKKRIASIPRDELTAFLDQIPRQKVRSLVRRLPDIQGFRTDSDAAIDQQKRRLIRRLTDETGNGANKTDWLIFRQLWWHWVEMRLGATSIKSAVQQYMSADANAGPNQEEVLLACINDAERRLVSREAFTEFFRFAPFAESNDTAEIIALAIPEADLKDKQLLADLRGTIRAVESQMTALRESMASLIGRDEAASMFRSELAKSGNSTSDDIRSLESRLSTIEEANNDSKALLSQLHTDVVAIVAQIEMLQAMQNVLNEQAKSIEDLERRVLSKVAANADSGNRADLPFYVPSLQVRLKGTIEDAADLFAAIKRNLITLGADREAVVRLAAAVLAGLCTGQLVSFKGAFATLMLPAIVPLISQEAYLLDVDLGYHEDAFARSLYASGGKPFLCAVFVGANRGAFDLYARAVVDDLVIRQMNLQPRKALVVLATLMEGASSIPVSPTTAALGPIISTDNLNWRRSKSSDVVVEASNLSVAPWELRDWGTSAPEFVSGIYELLGSLHISSRAVTQLSIRNAGNVLQALVNESACTLADAEIALLSYWFIPYLTSCGVPLEHIRRKLLSSDFVEHVNHVCLSDLLSVGNIRE